MNNLDVFQHNLNTLIASAGLIVSFVTAIFGHKNHQILKAASSPDTTNNK